MQDRVKPHFANIMSNDITNENVEEAIKQYQMYGAGEIKKRDGLTPANLFHKVELWWRHKMGCNPHVRLTTIVRDMLRSGGVLGWLWFHFIRVFLFLISQACSSRPRDG